MSTAEINGAELFYTQTGSGTPFVFLHGGLGLDHTGYRNTLRPLEDLIRFVYVDQRGNGRSERVDLETISMPQLADDVEALREHLGLERIGIAGHSYGGFVALEYAAHYPSRLTHLLVIGTSPGAFEPTEAELAERPSPSWITPEIETARRAFAQGVPSSNIELAEMVTRIAPAYARSVPPRVIDTFLSDSVLDAATMKRGFDALEGWSVEAQLDRISCPTLVLCGRFDLFTTPECSRRLATRIPGADLVWFERSGHFPWLEEPDAFFSAVRDWLRASS